MIEHKIVVAGCGGMSNTWLDYAESRKNAEIVGLVDVNIDAARGMAERRSLDVPAFSDLSQAIKETNANLVFDVTIPAAHKHIVTTAFEAGCNVFGEKPMAESLEDAKAVLHMSQKTGKKYSVMQNRRYLKQIRAFQHLLSSEVIGKVGSIHADFFLGPHFGGFRDVMDNPLIVDMAIHTFDQARFITGADAISVYCHEYNPPGSWYNGNASAICIFEMNDGSVFTYRGSWCAIGMQTSWEADWRVTGSKGSARWDGNRLPVYEVIDHSQPTDFIDPIKTEEVQSNWEGQEGHWGCLDEMFASLEENRLAETDCSDNIKSMEMVFGAVESAKTGKKILL
ncbi:MULTISPECIES: Gfo/Idh/MocA family protein [Metabacillus]|uniref:Oxidoreductase n=2 Tax=Metabacillus TaxID=2675233 RepID=A0A179SNS1_9BACI|nr:MULTISPECIES: Gfo/Idh/MocA family oxidoreductase [Metabacillus]OAS82579.1 oxidoreductase [Metabacillus litoralis]QNF26765.1 Gfo/Idh/MocA family oxidoreductase [Metabacillus sp. KUDC1714]